MLRTLLFVTFLLMTVWPVRAQTPPSAVRRLNRPPTLDTALAALPPDALERGSVLLTVRADEIMPGDGLPHSRFVPDTPPADDAAAQAARASLATDLSTPEGIAAKYGQILESYGRVLTLAPRTMAVLNVSPDARAIPLAELAQTRPLPFLLGLLTDAQWQTLATRGLAYADMTPDQQSLFIAALPDPLETVPVTAKEFSLTEKDMPIWESQGPEHDALMQKMNDAQHLYDSQVQSTPLKDALPTLRLRAFPDTEFSFSDPAGHYGVGLDPSQQNPVTSGPMQLAHGGRSWERDQKYGQRLAAHLKSDQPNELKDGDLSWNRPELLRPVSLQALPTRQVTTPHGKVTRPATVHDLITAVAKATGLELYADPRYGAQSLFLTGDTTTPQPARDILRALCLAVAGTWRAVGPAFVLTDDVQGLGARHALIKETMQSWINRLTEADRQIGGSLHDRKWAETLPFAPGDPAAITPAQMTALAGQSKGKAYNGTLSWQDLPAALQSSLRSQLSAMDYGDDRYTQNAHAIAQSLNAKSKVSVDINLHFALEMPGAGIMPFGEQYRVQPPEPPKMEDELAKMPPAKPVTLTGAMRGILCAPQTPAEAKLVVDRLPALGMNTLYCDVFTGGRTYFPNAALPPDGDAGKVLDAALAEASGKHIAVYAVLDTFCWGKDTTALAPTAWPTGIAPDLTVLGETPDATLQRRLDAKTLPDNFMEQSMLPGMARQTWVSPQEPQVQTLLPALARSLAATPGLAGVAFQDTAPPGYAESDNYDIGQLDTDLGYTPAPRLTYLRAHSADPIDSAQEDELNLFLPYGGFNTELDVSIPTFVSDNDGGKDWTAYRAKADRDVLAQCFRAAKAAAPALPLLMRERKVGFSFEPWTDALKPSELASRNVDTGLGGPQSILCFPYNGEFRRHPNYMALFLGEFVHKGSAPPPGILFDLLGNGPEPLSALLDELAPCFAPPAARLSSPGGK